jgi:hypothetical protein
MSEAANPLAEQTVDVVLVVFALVDGVSAEPGQVPLEGLRKVVDERALPLIGRNDRRTPGRLS